MASGEPFGVFVSLPYATFLLLFDRQGGTCIEAPPIATRCVGRSALEVRDYFARRYGSRFVSSSVPAPRDPAEVREQMETKHVTLAEEVRVRRAEHRRTGR